MFKVRTSIDNKHKAQEIARKLVEDKVAVSVHIREVYSVYAWSGKVEDDLEYEVEILCSNTDLLYEHLVKLHPYQLMEFIIEKVDCSEGNRIWCDSWCKGGKA